MSTSAAPRTHPAGTSRPGPTSATRLVVSGITLFTPRLARHDAIHHLSDRERSPHWPTPARRERRRARWILACEHRAADGGTGTDRRTRRRQWRGSEDELVPRPRHGHHAPPAHHARRGVLRSAPSTTPAAPVTGGSGGFIALDVQRDTRLPCPHSRCRHHAGGGITIPSPPGARATRTGLAPGATQRTTITTARRISMDDANTTRNTEFTTAG